MIKISNYAPVGNLSVNHWSIEGKWLVTSENAVAKACGAIIRFRFHARDLHLVLGNEGSRPVRFRVRLDGKPPGPDHGVDVDEKGGGLVDSHRLYQLIRQKNEKIQDHTFEIEFLDPGVQAYAFTFG